MIRRCVPMLAVVAGMVVSGTAAVCAADTPYLSATVRVEDALQAENGLTFELFGEQAAVPLQITFANEGADEALSLPQDYLRRLGITWRERSDAPPTPISVEWQRVTTTTIEGDPVSVGLDVSVLLRPGERVTYGGVLHRSDGNPFSIAEHSLTLDIADAVSAIVDASGNRWTGGFVERGDVVIRILPPPSGPRDIRRKRLADAVRATAHEQYAAALRLYQDALRDNPADTAARAGAGEAYMLLGRFQEAIVELEAVLPHQLHERSLLPAWLAYSYLSIGEDARAEALLRSLHGAAAATRELNDLRAAIGRR